MCECGERGGRGGMGDHRTSNMGMCGRMCVVGGELEGEEVMGIMG